MHKKRTALNAAVQHARHGQVHSGGGDDVVNPFRRTSAGAEFVVEVDFIGSFINTATQRFSCTCVCVTEEGGGEHPVKELATNSRHFLSFHASFYTWKSSLLIITLHRC